MVSTVTGLVSCDVCRDGKRYTPKGLHTHTELLHKVCSRCGCNIAAYRQMFGTRHNCTGAETLWPYPDGEGTRG